MLDGTKETKHAYFAASSAHRWLNCPLSVTRGAEIPDGPSSIYALEGTAAHSLGEYCLTNKKDPLKFVGKKIKGIEVTKEMSEAVKIYVDYCEDMTFLNSSKGEYLGGGIEAKFFVHDTDRKVGGTVDYYRYIENEIEIIDYKHGAGVAVDAEGNKQLMCYALAVVESIRMSIDKIKITIVQPRAKGETIKSWNVTRKDLDAFKKNILAAIERQKKSPEQANCGNWCKWCKVEAACPKLFQEAENLAVKDFKPNQVDDIFIAAVIRKAPMIRSYLSAVEKHAWQQMVAERKKIEGLKIVQGNGRRQIIEEKEAMQILKAAGYKQSAYLKPVFKTLGDLEKSIKEEDLNSILTRKDGALKIVPKSDKAPEWTPAQADFKKLDDEDLTDW